MHGIIKDELLNLEREKKAIQAKIETTEDAKMTIDPMLPRAVYRYMQLIAQLEAPSAPPDEKIKQSFTDIVGHEIVLRPNQGNTHILADMHGDYVELLRISGESELKLVAGVGNLPNTP